MRPPFWLVRRAFSRSYFEPIPEQCEVVRAMFAMYLNGASTQKIADRLNAEAPGGSRWSAAGVGRVLKDRAVIGEKAILKKAGEKTEPNVFPQVIATEDFRDVQSLLALERDARGADPGVNILRHRCFCECGKPAAYEALGASGRVLICKTCRDMRPVPMRYFEAFLFTAVGLDVLFDTTRRRELRTPLGNLWSAQRALFDVAASLDSLGPNQLAVRLQEILEQVINAQGQGPIATTPPVTDDFSTGMVALKALRGDPLTEEQREVCRRRLQELDTKVVLRKCPPTSMGATHTHHATFELSGGLLGMLARDSRLGVGDYVSEDGILVYVGFDAIDTDEEEIFVRVFRREQTLRGPHAPGIPGR
jgi:hypothetical protein